MPAGAAWQFLPANSKQFPSDGFCNPKWRARSLSARDPVRFAATLWAAQVARRFCRLGPRRWFVYLHAPSVRRIRPSDFEGEPMPFVVFLALGLVAVGFGPLVIVALLLAVAWKTPAIVAWFVRVTSRRPRAQQDALDLPWEDSKCTKEPVQSLATPGEAGWNPVVRNGVVAGWQRDNRGQLDARRNRDRQPRKGSRRRAGAMPTSSPAL